MRARLPTTAILLLSAILCFPSCVISQAGSLSGLEKAKGGTFTKLDHGIVYAPIGCENFLSGNSSSVPGYEKWPVTVILHGYGELSYGLSNRYFWKEYADRFGIVLFFVETGHMGWDERTNSADTRLIKDILRSFRAQPWLATGKIQLLGWSAGSIMALGLLPENRALSRKPPLFDQISLISGGFGEIMLNESQRNPKLRGIRKIPAFFVWGDAEGADHGMDAAKYLRSLGWNVSWSTHPGGHYIDPNLAEEALARNRK